MATWTYTITPTDLVGLVGNVTARRHGVDVRRYTMADVSFKPTAEKTMAQIRDEIETAMIALYEADVTNEGITAALKTQEALLAAETNAKEAE
ncbi:MAG TPA: hypothetical protein VMY35_07785 [Phycisphaerae bacterium]|nr:hypothetical protein [Phycisphaerae bacterium]